MTTPRSTTTARAALAVSCVLGVAHAGISLSWLLGSTWLLDTVGEPFLTWGTEREPATLLALGVVVLAKLAAVGVAALGVLRGRRAWRLLGWSAAVVLLVHGVLMTIGNGLVALDVVSAADGADRRAIAWHAAFWDPWFALWGAASVVALWLSRTPGRAPQRPRRAGPA